MKQRNYYVLGLIITLLTSLTTCDLDVSKNTQEMFTVSFQANGGNPSPEQQKIAYGEKATAPHLMHKTSFGFGGWFKEKDCINQWHFDKDIVIGNITLYAKWDINFHIVSFEANGGSPIPVNQEIAHGSEAVMPSDVHKTGFGLVGWFKEPELTNQWDFDNDKITENIILYAKWLEIYTVSFEANGGNPQPVQQGILCGNKVSEPPFMSKIGFNFEGWYKEADLINIWDFESDIVIENTTLYAKWGPLINVPGTNFNMKMRWLESNAQSGCAYIIEFNSDESIGPSEIFFINRSGISLTMKGIGSTRIVSINTIEPNISMFTIGSGVTLILDENLELRGSIYNYSSAGFITVNSGGNLVLNNNVKITGYRGGGVHVKNNSTFTMNGGVLFGNSYLDSIPSGSGVYINSGGVFIMNDGHILGNSLYVPNNNASSIVVAGGGVHIDDGTFIMNNGRISGNSLTAESISNSSSNGGGVYFNNGTFIMNGGEISENFITTDTFSSNSPSSRAHGGGIYINNGTFTLNNGKISGNISTSSIPSTASFLSNGFYSSGGGVYLNNGIFIMKGGEIIGNTTSSLRHSTGGGVHVNSGTFTMSDGKISDNSTTGTEDTSITYSYGGGVYVQNKGIFNMNGGEISGNNSLNQGGGVYINGSIINTTDGSIFNKTGGIIYGYSENNTKSNVSKDPFGIIKSKHGHAIFINHNNSVYLMGKDTTSDLNDNLSFNCTVTPPSWFGEWDF